MTRNDWLSSLPAAPTVKQSAAAIRAARDYGRAAIDRAKATFQGGTLPPPPWPATPELEAAMADIEKAVDGVAVYENFTPNATVPAATVARGRELGLRVFDEADKLLERAGEVSEQTPTTEAVKVVKRKAASLALGDIPPWVVVAGLLYLAWRYEG